MARLRRVVAVVAFLVCIIATGCTRDAAHAGQCETMHRLASNDVQIMSLDPASPVARPMIACVGLACLRSEPGVIVVVQPDGALWGAWNGEPGRVVSDAKGALVGEVPAQV